MGGLLNTFLTPMGKDFTIKIILHVSNKKHEIPSLNFFCKYKNSLETTVPVIVFPNDPPKANGMMLKLCYF